MDKLMEKKIYKKLEKVMDPELMISVVDLGLIYKVRINKMGDVQITMTLTTMGCPLFDLMEKPIKEEIAKIKGVRKVEVCLTFEPAWNPDMISKEARTKLGFF